MRPMSHRFALPAAEPDPGGRGQMRPVPGRVRRFLREPLVHFLLIGAALFVVFRWTGGSSAEPARRIVIRAAEVERQAATFSRVWMRPPTADELRGLIEKTIREEVYSREAVAMGLDRDDSVIRRRLQQKLEFLSEDVAAARKPTESELEAYLRSHSEKFRTDAKLSFRQVYFSRERGAAEVERRATAMLSRLRAEGAAAPIEDTGDRISLPSDVEEAVERDVARDFDPDFVAKLRALPVGSWEGPIESGYGIHLVLVRSRREGVIPKLDSVRDAVLREWQAARRVEVNEEIYRSMRARYTVSIELPAWARQAAPPAR